MFADITGENGLFFFLKKKKNVGHGQSLPGCLSGRRQESLDSILRIPPWLGVSHLVFLNVSGSTWEVSLNHPSLNWLSKLDVGVANTECSM